MFAAQLAIVGWAIFLIVIAVIVLAVIGAGTVLRGRRR